MFKNSFDWMKWKTISWKKRTLEVSTETCVGKEQYCFICGNLPFVGRKVCTYIADVFLLKAQVKIL